jgi:tetratricopeptide (TPR) repeat protein
MLFRATIFLGLALALPALPATAQTAGQDAPQGFDALAAQADAARAQNDAAGAARLYAQALALNPAWSDGWWYLGNLQYATDNYPAAVDALTHYLGLMPKAGPAYALRGLCEFEAAQYPESLQDIQQAIALGAANDPRNAGILVFHQAMLLTRLGRFEEALAKYRVLVQHGGLSPQVLEAIGITGLRLPVVPSELDPAQQELASLVGQAAADIMAGDPHSAPGTASDTDKAAAQAAEQAGAQAFAQLFARFPTQPYIHYLYGYLLSVTDPGEAIAQFHQELNVSPASAIANSRLAWDMGVRDDYAEALPYARASAQEDPSLPMAQLVLGRDLVETGDMAAALPHIDAVLKGDPDNLEAHLALVKAYADLGRADDARRERLLCLDLSKKRAAPDANL